MPDCSTSLIAKSGHEDQRERDKSHAHSPPAALRCPFPLDAQMDKFVIEPLQIISPPSAPTLRLCECQAHQKASFLEASGAACQA